MSAVLNAAACAKLHKPSRAPFCFNLQSVDEMIEWKGRTSSSRSPVVLRRQPIFSGSGNQATNRRRALVAGQRQFAARLGIRDRPAAIDDGGKRHRIGRNLQCAIIRLGAPGANPFGAESTTKPSAPKRNPIVAASPFARSREYIVRNDIMIDAADKGSVGSCSGDRVAQRPSSCNTTSASYPQGVSS